MRKSQMLFWFAAAMAMSGFAGAVVAQEGKIQGIAIVRGTHGQVKYSQEVKLEKLKPGPTRPRDGTRYWNSTVIHWRDAQWFTDSPVRSFELPQTSYEIPRTELPPGTTIQTSPDSYLWASVNGLSSVVRIGANSTLQLQTMEREGSARLGNFTTVMDLKQGTMLCSVRKLSGQSRYEIHTPHGTAAVRGTDFQVTVTPSANKDCAVTFICLTGEIAVSATVEDAPVAYVLHTGEKWNPDWRKRVGATSTPEGPRPAARKELRQMMRQFLKTLTLDSF
jgi:hypothetical protein